MIKIYYTISPSLKVMDKVSRIFTENIIKWEPLTHITWKDDNSLIYDPKNIFYELSLKFPDKFLKVDKKEKIIRSNKCKYKLKIYDIQEDYYVKNTIKYTAGQRTNF